MLLPATVLLVAILVIPLWEHNFSMIAITSGAMLTGFLLYPLMQLAKERRWVRFADLEFDFEHETAGTGLTYTITATGGLNDDPTYNAEYVDVVHDGICRTTGSSMDLGSISFGGSMRGPGSFSESMGRSPRSPLGAVGLGVAEDGAGLKVGSAPSSSPSATAAAAAVAASRSHRSSRFRRAAAAMGDGCPGVSGSPGGGGEGGGGVGRDGSSRLQAGKGLSSFRLRVSNEASWSDSGEGTWSPTVGDQVDAAVGPPSSHEAAAQQSGGSGSSSVGQVHSAANNKANGF